MRESPGSRLDRDNIRLWARTADSSIVARLGVYIDEAEFFWPLILKDLARIPSRSTVVEVGSGVGLLSRAIASQGHRVVAFEPASAGFGQIAELARVVDSAWMDGMELDVRTVPEPFNGQEAPEADLVVGINVLEHALNPGQLVVDATRRLARGGRTRFICPNYSFPYEPHFGFPTAWSKSLTGRVHRRRIALSADVEDPLAFWEELSWPTMRRLRKRLREEEIPHEFSREAIRAYLHRLGDSQFVSRKGGAFNFLARCRQPLATVVSAVPLRLAPIIDLSTSRD